MLKDGTARFDRKSAAYHAGRRSCSELAPWLFALSEQVVVLKDSALLACYQFEGIDPDGATNSQLNALAAVAEAAHLIFANHPITLWWKVDRRKTTFYPGGRFPDPCSQAIDDARRHSFECGNNRINTHTLCVAMLPDVGRRRFMARLQRAMHMAQDSSLTRAVWETIKTFYSDQQAFSYSRDEMDAAGARFEELLSSFTGAFGTQIRFQRFSAAALGGYLSRCFGQLHEQQDVTLDDGWFLDALLPGVTIEPEKDYLVFSGGRELYAKLISVKGFPQPAGQDKLGHTQPGQHDPLLTLAGDISLSQVFRYAGRKKALHFMRAVRRYNDIARLGWRGILSGALKGSTEGVRVDSAREAESAQTEEAIAKTGIGQTVAGWYNCTVVCYGDTLQQASTLAEQAEACLRSARFMPVHETEGALSAWASTIPGQWGEIVRMQFLDHTNLANLAPLRTISRGQIRNEYLSEQLGVSCPPLAVMATDYGTPFYYVHYVMHIGHKIFIGPSRTGKTTKANFLWTSFRKYPDARVLVFDIDYSARIPILLQGGKYVDMSSDSLERPRLNPLVLLKEERHLAYLVRFIRLLCQMRGYRVKAHQEIQIEQALRATRALSDPARQRLMSVYTQITDEELRQELALWVGDRPYGRYFDNAEDDFDLGSLVGIEVRTILRDEMTAVPFMDLAFYRIQACMADERLQGRIVPTVIYIPEVWYFLKNPQFAQQMENYLKTIARYASSLWMDTQSPDELIQSGIFGALRDNVKTVIFTPNRKARSASLRQIYLSEFALTDSQLERIASAQAQRDYFIRQDDLSRMIQPQFDRNSLAILASDRKAQIIFDRFYQQGAPADTNWKQAYLHAMCHPQRAGGQP